MTQRFDYGAAVPEALRKFSTFSLSLQKGAIEQSLHHLVVIRASQLNGCAFCVDMHVKEARRDGEQEIRLHHLPIWSESPLFSARERAALELTELLTNLPAGGIADADYDRLAQELGETDLAELCFHIIAINGWNRLGVTFRAVPGSRDKEFGLEGAIPG